MRLREALDQVPDHRKSQGRRHPLGAVLSLAVGAMLCGARSLYAIAQWGRDQGVTTGQLLGFSRGQTPCVATFHRVFKDLDVAAFEAVLGEWLINSGVDLGRCCPWTARPCGGFTGKRYRGCIWCQPMLSDVGRCWPRQRRQGRVRNWRQPKKCWVWSRFRAG